MLQNLTTNRSQLISLKTKLIIERASDAIGCDPKFFVNDAAVWKAKGVMKRLNTNAFVDSNRLR